MDQFSNAVINALGGTTAVAHKTRTGVSTVHNWRKHGLSESRLDHLRRIARDEAPAVDLEQIARAHGVELPVLRTIIPASGDAVSA